MYGVAVVGLRIAHRRTLSQWTAIDFAAAVAIGTVMGRTAVADLQRHVVAEAFGSWPGRTGGTNHDADLRGRPPRRADDDVCSRRAQG
jgi:hypothetical protein